MSESVWKEALQAQGAAFAGDGSVDHFGDARGEWESALQSCVAIPVTALSRIRVTGRDRAKFLHNFCTNDIVGLESGRSCEAFFTDVKAHVIAHVYVLSGTDCHEIWMLGGDEQRLVNHLCRYVITEDVTIEAVGEHFRHVALVGPEVVGLVDTGEVGTWSESTVGHVSATLVHLQWSDTPIVFMSVAPEDICGLWKAICQQPAGHAVLSHLRVLERLPLVGIDIGEDHLAPEADRNTTAISYTKGCYLGQEPIARIDAIGHVNRKLVRIKLAGDDVAPLPEVLTTVSQLETDHRIALGVIRLADVNAEGQIILDASSGLMGDLF